LYTTTVKPPTPRLSGNGSMPSASSNYSASDSLMLARCPQGAGKLSLSANDEIVQPCNCFLNVQASLRCKTASHLYPHALKLLCHSSKYHFNSDPEL
jgi:hypothetical protein